jgi:hypothetical protein
MQFWIGFFDKIKVEVVSSEKDGWSKIRDKQPFWTILTKETLWMINGILFSSSEILFLKGRKHVSNSYKYKLCLFSKKS